jgi:hypothetical protein
MSKPRRHPKPPNPKRTGEHSEVAFLCGADQRRFAISKPFGDSERYDFILDNRTIPGARPKPSRGNAGTQPPWLTPTPVPSSSPAFSCGVRPPR